MIVFAGGGIVSIALSKSSNPIPLPSSGGGSGFSGRFGGGLDGFPDLVARELGTVRQPLAGDVGEDDPLALHVVISRLDAVVPTEVELVAVAL